MAPGLPAVWSSRCAVCLLVAAGAALGPSGPLGGTAHASPASAGPSVSATPSGTPSPAATPPLPSGAVPSSVESVEPSALPLPSGALSSGAGEPGGSPSADFVYGDGAEAPASSASPSPSRSASVEVSGSTAPLAGREAGAGKVRPGRSLTPLELARAETPDEPEPPDEPEQSAVGLPESTVPPEEFSETGAQATRALDAAAVRQVQQVSLGTGIALVGLGLAFLAFRLRRVN
ncbi:hypothetical protein NJO91_09070 [Streptomyces microflavus]|uniref:hypothetical protein n=1 Tax=Streptomyces microflavus TaxID=1919 RepID=UPI0029ADF9E0|nr:hypothetical protein [Streptomyces microflavus]MDX2403277.1 hypothetical protein [Streptomyces microflavus]